MRDLLSESLNRRDIVALLLENYVYDNDSDRVNLCVELVELNRYIEFLVKKDLALATSDYRS